MSKKKNHLSENNALTPSDIAINDLYIGFNGKVIYNGASFVFPAGTLSALTGPSGSGKTTLLRAIAGLLPYKGTIETGRRPVSFAFQTPRLLPWLTVRDNVTAPLIDKSSADATKIADEWLTRLGLSDSLDKYPDELSGGMALRVSLARAFAAATPGCILLLDEPTKEIDKKARQAVTEIILGFRGKCTIIAATYDDELIANADQTVDTVINLNSAVKT